MRIRGTIGKVGTTYLVDELKVCCKVDLVSIDGMGLEGCENACGLFLVAHQHVKCKDLPL